MLSILRLGVNNESSFPHNAFVSTYAGAQTNQQSNSPVQLLYGTRTPDERRHGPVISGVLNLKVLNQLEATYPQKAKDKNIQGRVEIELLVNEDGEVIFTNPLSGPEELWAESVKAAVAARFKPLTLSGEPVKITGRLILDFKTVKLSYPGESSFGDGRILTA